MAWGGGVGDGPDAASLTRLTAGGGSSLSKDIMLDVLRGSDGRDGALAVAGAGLDAWADGGAGGAWP